MNTNIITTIIDKAKEVCEYTQVLRAQLPACADSGRESRAEVKDMEWEIMSQDEDEGITLYYIDHRIHGMSPVEEYAAYVPARITDGVNTIDFWVVEDAFSTVAMFDATTKSILISEDVINAATARQLMAIALHESWHAKKRGKKLGLIRFGWYLVITNVPVLNLLTKWEEYQADMNAHKHGYGDDLAQWLIDMSDDEEYKNMYFHLLKSKDSHPPMILRVRYLTSK